MVDLFWGKWNWNGWLLRVLVIVVKFVLMMYKIFLKKLYIVKNIIDLVENNWLMIVLLYLCFKIECGI